MTRIKQFPHCLFVTVEHERDEDYFLTSATKRDALDGEQKRRIALYKLVEVQEVSERPPTSRTLKSRKV